MDFNPTKVKEWAQTKEATPYLTVLKSGTPEDVAKFFATLTTKHEVLVKAAKAAAAKVTESRTNHNMAADLAGIMGKGNFAHLKAPQGRQAKSVDITAFLTELGVVEVAETEDESDEDESN